MLAPNIWNTREVHMEAFLIKTDNFATNKAINLIGKIFWNFQIVKF